MTPSFAQVMVLQKLPRPLTYQVPSEMEIVRGDVVQVPLGNRQVLGVVWELQAPDVEQKVKDTKKFVIKSITHKHPLCLSVNMLQFAQKVADYCATDLPSVLKMVLSVPKALVPAKIDPKYSLKVQPQGKITAARQKVIDYMQDKPALSLADIHTQTGIGKAVIKALIEANILGVTLEQPQDTITQSILQPNPPKLSDAQQHAANTLCHEVQTGGYKTTLLDGVTGSGKTEVYFAAMEEACKHPEGQVLVLLPEIILTAQWVRRFKDRFGVEPVSWHSNLTESKRIAVFRDIASGKARIIVGARSALFLPYKNLKLIVIDEEHDSSFKQEEGVTYHGRDMAIIRAYIEKIPIILASATPAIETVNNIHLGKYQELKLPTRFNASMPQIDIIDMRKSQKPHSPWISKELTTAIEEHLSKQQQVLLFLNRRGYAPLTLCKECGHRFECTACSGWLVRHESPARLMCHRCGFQRAIPKECPECQASECLVSCGPGIQRIGEAVSQLWPHAKIALMDSVHIANNDIREHLIRTITKGEVDIIIGTQVIAKGHHFPKLSLVGIIDADVGLSGGDLRAAERCFQLLHQVSGRAGREKTQGHVLIQSYMPENAVIQALATGDRDAFITSELYSREVANMPPFSRLVSIVVSGKNKDETERFARQLVRMKPQSDTIDVFGPVPAALFLVRHQYRFSILVKAPNNIHVQRWVTSWLSFVTPPNSVKVKVDVDPYNFS